LDPLGWSVERLNQLIDDVLVTERLDGEAAGREPVEVRLGLIMAQAMASAVEEARHRGIPFVARFDPALSVCVDPTLSIAALRNVIDNAVRFAGQGDGGSQVEIEVEDRGGEVAVHVRDTRRGAPPGAPAAALDESAADAARDPIGGAQPGPSGTRLGVVVARRRVLMQGWTVTAEYSSTAGCHFCLTLPREPRGRRSAVWPAVPAPAKAPAT
jgi:signal transduction histidine kinase